MGVLGLYEWLQLLGQKVWHTMYTFPAALESIRTEAKELAKHAVKPGIKYG